MRPRRSGEHLATVTTEHMIECTEADRRRIFNLGYYTWVEQQGTPFELFEARRHQDFWRDLRRFVGVWDDMITDFNARARRMTCRVGSGTTQQVAGDRVPTSELDALGWECAVCGARRDIADPLPFRCPNATAADRHHVLRLRSRELLAHAGTQEVHENEAATRSCGTTRGSPGRRSRRRTGCPPDARRALVETVDSAIGQVDGVGFRVTPFATVRRPLRPTRLQHRPAGCG